jgi:hypothetical protein
VKIVPPDKLDAVAYEDEPVVCWRDVGPDVNLTMDEVRAILNRSDVLAVPSAAEAERCAWTLGEAHPIIVVPRPVSRWNPEPPPLASRQYRHAVVCSCGRTPDRHETLQTNVYGHEREGMATNKPWWAASWQLPVISGFEDIRIAIVPHDGEYHGAEPWLLPIAQGAGCCVIAQEYPGIDEIHKDDETVVVWRKRQDIIAVLRELLRDEARAQRIATGGHAVVAARAPELWAQRILTEAATWLP